MVLVTPHYKCGLLRFFCPPKPYPSPSLLVTEWLVQRLDRRSASERSLDQFPERTKRRGERMAAWADPLCW